MWVCEYRDSAVLRRVCMLSVIEITLSCPLYPHLYVTMAMCTVLLHDVSLQLIVRVRKLVAGETQC